jgi:hypothetical protein
LASQTDNEFIRAEVEKIQASGVLGRSRFYTAMLQYLADCAERGHAPKEIEIAAEVFNRGDGFDPSQDSMVRVYAHNLRQKLEQYYSDRETDDSDRISIPKGEYRIVVGGVPDKDGPTGEEPRGLAGHSMNGRRVALIVAVSLVAGAVLDRMLTRGPTPVETASEQVAASVLWSPVTDDNVPVTIVVGDYYIFAELDETGNVGRLVREFSINSSRDLDERFMLDPDAAERYLDLDLTYLPSSIAVALRDVVTVLNAADKEMRIVSMSNLASSEIRENHIVYLGYLSGLGLLRDFVFAGSELSVGDTFDELVHIPTGEIFVSEAGMPSERRSYRDYGLFSTQPAPGGHQFVFIAGTRDEGLMQTARAVTDRAMVQTSIDAITPGSETPAAFELLYEVAGLGRTNLDAEIVHAGPLAADRLSIGQALP